MRLLGRDSVGKSRHRGREKPKGSIMGEGRKRKHKFIITHYGPRASLKIKGRCYKHQRGLQEHIEVNKHISLSFSQRKGEKKITTLDHEEY